MPRSTVAILKTQPNSVISDYHELLNLAGYQDVVDRSVDTALKSQYLLALLLSG